METQAGEFVTQAREHLTVLERLLLSLEKPGARAEDRERLDGCLRLVHSLKGDAGFLGFTAIRTLANAMETVLETMRDQEAPVSTVAIERLLLARDRLATLVDDLDNSHGADLRDILAQLSVGPIRQQLGLPATAAKIPAETALSLSVDLGEWTRTSQRSLVDLLAELGLLGDFEDPRLDLATHDLRTMLPTAPIVLRGRLRTSLSRSEVDHRLLLPTIDRDLEAPTIDIAAAPLALTPRPESRPSVAVGPAAGPRRCGSTWSCSTGS
jgi:two-component system, chemotaxis family, sensor kinase CheA